LKPECLGRTRSLVFATARRFTLRKMRGFRIPVIERCVHCTVRRREYAKALIKANRSLYVSVKEVESRAVGQFASRP
jgi:hypothetical protein